MAEPSWHRNLHEPHPRRAATRRPALNHVLAEFWLLGRVAQSGSALQDPGVAEGPPASGWRLHARAFLGKGAVAPSWSHDGMRLVYFMNGTGDPGAYSSVNGRGDPLFVADRNGGEAKEIPVPRAHGEEPKVDGEKGFFETGIHNHNPVWSSDGEWIYFVHGLEPGSDMDIYRIRPTGGTPERMTEQHTFMNSLAPLDARTLLYVARQDDGSGPWLWALDVPSKVTRRVSVGVEQYTSASASRDGRRVVATVASSSRNSRSCHCGSTGRPTNTMLWRIRWGPRVRLRRASTTRRCSIYLHQWDPLTACGASKTVAPSNW